MPTIAVAGHICLDLTPRLSAPADLTPGRLTEVGPLALTLGGSVANTGRVLADLGDRVVPFAGIGDDQLGELLLSRLNALGFDTARLAVVPGASTSFSVVVEQPGADRTFWHHTGANTSFDGAGIDIADATVLHVGYPPLLPALLDDRGAPLHALLAAGRRAGAATSVDLAVVDPDSPAGRADWPAIYSAMSAVTDLLSPSLDDLTSALRIDEPFSVDLVDRLARRFLDDGVAIVAISAGDRGLYVRTADAARFRESGPALAAVSGWAGRSLHVPAQKIENPATTTGAGDATSAGLIHALATGLDLDDAARFATACSAAVISGRRPTPDVVAAIAADITAP